MGTLFQTIFSQESPGLRIMGQMGYDVVTPGKNEFDFRPEGLANNLNVAKASKERLPQMVNANISFPLDDEGKINQSLQGLKELVQS